MTIPQLVAALARRPFHMPPEVAGRLTFVQIGLLLQNASGEPAPSVPAMTEEEQFWLWGRDHKLADYQIRQLWAERQKSP